VRLLGLSCFYHDAAACLLEDGVLVAAAQEERFTRVKHDARFPENAIRYCLAEGGGAGTRLDGVVFYDKPLLKFHRILETYLSVAPSGLRQFMKSLPLWLREKLWIEPEIREALARCEVDAPDELWFPEHHESHAASAFYPSPFREAAVLTVDGVGEWATATLGVGEGARLELLEQISFPHSLGLLYSAFTSYAGFQVNDGEYKLMGLAPYGEPSYAQLIRERLVDVKPDGSFRLDMRYFGWLDDLVMTSARFEELLGRPPRTPGAPITRDDMNLARSIQVVLEEILLAMARHARARTGKRHLCLAGGVALNCVANGRILREGIFDDLWIQPAAGDAGGAVGAAYSVWHNVLGMPREADDRCDRMQGACLGPEFAPARIRAFLDARGMRYRELGDLEWAPTVAKALAEHEVVGLFQGRMEFGPRALGNRSILGDPRSPKMQSLMNRKIKFRESFRPFAPACLEERVSEYFELDRPSPYMLLVAPVRAERRLPPRGDEAELSIEEWVNRERSDLPAITHVDGSARIQTVSAAANPRLHALLSAFEAQTGCGVLINTSFNVRDEPIVCTPEDALRCFLRTEMDRLVLGPFLLTKGEQPDAAQDAPAPPALHPRVGEAP
jgi:carbamoyltransferase